MMISKETLHIWTTNDTSLQNWPSEARKVFWHARRWAMTQKPNDLSEEFIIALNEADKKFFMRWKPTILLPTIFAWILLIFGILVEFLFLWIWKNVFTSTNTGANNILLIFIGLFILLLIQYILLHLPAHFLVSKVLRIEVWKIFIAASSLRKGPFPLNHIFTLALIPGLKYDLASFLRQSKFRRALMLAAGIWIPYPILVLNLSLFIFFPSPSQPNILNIFIIIFLVVFILFGILTSGLWYGDLYKTRLVYKKDTSITFEK